MSPLTSGSAVLGSSDTETGRAGLTDGKPELWVIGNASRQVRRQVWFEKHEPTTKGDVKLYTHGFLVPRLLAFGDIMQNSCFRSTGEGAQRFEHIEHSVTVSNANDTFERDRSVRLGLLPI